MGGVGVGAPTFALVPPVPPVLHRNGGGAYLNARCGTCHVSSIDCPQNHGKSRRNGASYMEDQDVANSGIPLLHLVVTIISDNTRFFRFSTSVLCTKLRICFSRSAP